MREISGCECDGPLWPTDRGKLSSSHCSDALAALDGLSWSSLIPQALVFQEEVEACGIYLSLELAMTIRNETCVVHYYLPLCCEFLFKFTPAQCVVWREFHAAGILLIDRQNNICCVCTEQAWCAWQELPCASWFSCELLWLPQLCPVGKAGRNAMSQHLGRPAHPWAKQQSLLISPLLLKLQNGFKLEWERKTCPTEPSDFNETCQK